MKKPTKTKAKNNANKSVSYAQFRVERDKILIGQRSEDGKSSKFGYLSPYRDSDLHNVIRKYGKEQVEEILTSAPVPDTCRGFLWFNAANAIYFPTPNQKENGATLYDDIILRDVEQPLTLIRSKMNLDKYFRKSDGCTDKVRCNFARTIVLLLESPHTDEYDDDMNPKVPACGSTGRQLSGCRTNSAQRHIDWIATHLKENFIKLLGCYPLILCNPIQYQTSLHHLLGNNWKRKIRNDVWKQIWEIPAVKKDFISRFEKYNPALIINACTSPASAEVEKYVLGRCNLNADIYYCSSYHPSSWNTNQNPENNNAYGLKYQKNQKRNNQ